MRFPPTSLERDWAAALQLGSALADAQPRLTIYQDLLLRWQGMLNLVSPDTLPNLWTRHVADSAQLLDIAPGALRWADLGSGGGFPGLVLAILLAGKPGAVVHLIERDKRKAAFLQTVSRETGAPAQVHVAPIEAVAARPAAIRGGNLPGGRAAEAAHRLVSAAARTRRHRAFPERSDVPSGNRGRLGPKLELIHPAEPYRLFRANRFGAIQRKAIRRFGPGHFVTSSSTPRVLVLANQKGGVGKTTTTINLGTALAAIGERVLVIDLDPQGNASTGLGVDRKSRKLSTFEVLAGECRLADAIMPTAVPRLWLAPSTLDLLGIELQIANEKNRTFPAARRDSQPPGLFARCARRLHLRPDRLPAVAQPIDHQRAGERRQRRRAAPMRVLCAWRAFRSCFRRSTR